MPTATRAMSAWPTRRCGWARRRRPRAISSSTGCWTPRGGPGRPRSIRATASCRRARPSPCAVRDAGLVFVGPPPEAMERLGGKDSAKALLAPAGVPLVPGYHGADQADARLRDEAERIGFPLLIKATAGGGGKGMRRVDHAGRVPGGAGRLPARGQGRVRRRPGAGRAADRPAAPCRAAGVRRPARVSRPPVRARLHAAAPPPEDHRGGAGTRARPGAARGARAAPPPVPRWPPATRTRARSSSCSTSRAASTSSR